MEGLEDRIHNQKNFRICCSTHGIFDGWCLREIWERENGYWRKFINDPANVSYQFPSLGESVYLNDQFKLLRKPSICQDMFWADDGTSIVTVHDDYGIRQFLIPEWDSENKLMVPFTRFFRNQSVMTSKVHHKYSLFNDTQEYNVILLGTRNLPLQLLPLQSNDADVGTLQSYNVIDKSNETYLVPYALSFNGDRQFLAGFKRNKVSLYDLTRSQAVLSTGHTKQQCGRSIQKNIVSCFDQQSFHGGFAETTRTFGTYKNELYLFDRRIPDSKLLYRSREGRGLTQILKSLNGHYSYLIRRNSNKIEILDARQSFAKVNELKLPKKLSNQNMKACITRSGGLSIGTYHGTIVNWSKELIEFGGIERDSKAGEAPIPAEGEIQLNLPNSNVNVVNQSPIDEEIYAVSYSPDKSIEEPTGQERSGILIMENYPE
ncbi:hypothetical protein HG535_0G01350 [Zygotorulaspora mrakii]|uniref:Protein SWT21 n=1 Tax=Zygotorulaspora mrakii TaxID=42260 RepID=A0A7H9B6F2_ZYGMR|nr:uncharacterized protein HG535_0G01350 [Zygotorulaspora mrakii]QLG74251.1 hypothetical protein HG535_0G01350 [Zygotorulaspora mrakii]